MINIQNYVQAESLEEAYQLNQKRSARILGGMLWLKMANCTVGTAIDLCRLGLDTIEETDSRFSIGAMVSLRQLELHPGLNAYTNGAAAQAVQDIVGVQFRNMATVGGSVWGRFGFSDILTCLLALDAQVELYHEGILSLEEFAARPVRRDDRDILVRVIIRKDGRRAAYASQRNSQTDFPLIACCVSNLGRHWFVSIGARPGRARLARLVEDDFDTLPRLAAEAAGAFSYGTNMRGSGEYRHFLAETYTRRLMEQLRGRSVKRQ